MRGGIAALAVLALVGCARGFPGEEVGGFFEVYRDRDVPIASKATFVTEDYLGRWYEIARFPVPFEAGCVGVTADYGLLPDGDISVLNTCRNLDGSVKSTIAGRAEIVGPGRLAVSFNTIPFGAAPYWVLWTDEDYVTAVVGTPNGRAGWILNRTPEMRADRLEAARQVLAFNGYDLSRLQMVPQIAD